ncbi:transcription factor PIF3 isoform X1 [Ricinus communis]|uniref:transcription factor PIF3 isoform X1 n=2 Tax=Ricinus communis TaxID=3988 RepID=UPI000D694FEC|nr:transcription factor PIF3 isoform X1 [Ricinus communis]XP_025012429.1 transcription factor PIF3 isoform X1 [Ricinus communis]XP_025012430.1 transcription factor PIF3 isoform X1 [Ricinus communis]XP_025012431.1 transcription factor PIF3 isoform X1 [Ricinus communis]|eukprot:XP_025012428.1 transcription factor PIF3 isoform X1 [Ricinus communis]
MAASDEFMELVWENGQILTRGRSTSPSCISYSSQNPKPKVNTIGEDIYPRKRPRLGAMNSVLGLSSRQEFAKSERLLQDHHSEFSKFTESSKNSASDKKIIEPRILPVCQGDNSTAGNASVGEIPQLRQASNDQLQNQSSLQQCQVSAFFSRSTMDGSQSPSMGEFPYSNSKQFKSSGPVKYLGLRNFSLFLPGVVPPKANDQHQSATCSAGDPSSSRVQELEINKQKSAAALVDPVTGSENAKKSYKCPDQVATELDQARHITVSAKESLPDEQSEAPISRNDSKSKRIPDPTSSLEANTFRRKPNAEKYIDQLAAATSICSRRASNDLTHSSLKRTNAHLKEMASPSENADEEEEIPKSTSTKKKRIPQVHSLSERKRRDKINKKMRALQALIPNSDKVDKASMLDKAIEYLKTLQLQLQMMSMRGSCYMPPMMIPTALQQIQAPYLSHFSPMMGMRMPMSPSLFSNSAILGLAAGQMQPMAPMTSQTPFVPLVGGSSMQSTSTVTPFCGAAAAMPVKPIGLADPFSNLKEAVQNINSDMTGNVVNSQYEESFQATGRSCHH